MVMRCSSILRLVVRGARMKRRVDFGYQFGLAFRGGRHKASKQEGGRRKEKEPSEAPAGFPELQFFPRGS